MNILITGAAGFIGRNLIQKLALSSQDVFGLDNCAGDMGTAALPVKGFFDQDLTRPFRLSVPFDVVFHLGALNVTHVGQEDYSSYRRVNVDGTENLIKAVDARKFVFMSTAKVYREKEGLLDETSPIGPQSDYARSKWEAEELCRRNFAERDLTVFRPVNVVGPGQAEKAVIPVFFRRAIRHEPLEMIHSVRTKLQMLYIGDLLEAFELFLKKPQGLGAVNLCSEETVTLGSLAEQIIEICRSKSPIQIRNQEADLSGQISAGKAKRCLGWEAHTPLKDVLQNYYESVCPGN